MVSVSTVLVLVAGMSACSGTGGTGDTAIDYGSAWVPSEDVCIEEQLDAEQPAEVVVPSGYVMSCRPRWLHEQHCYGVPDAPNDRFPLEWEPWQHRYGYIDGERQQGMETLDVDPDPRTVLGPDDVCIYLDDSFLYSVSDVWEYDGWSTGSGNCGVTVVQQCRCNSAGEPDDPACLEISVP